MSLPNSHTVPGFGTSMPQAGGPAMTEIPARDSTTLARTVRDRLRLAVARDELPSGVRLSQEQVANQLGVSRMPVRAAISELVTEGLLEKLPGGGVAVRPLYVKDLQDVYEIRQALESQAVRHVATHRPMEGVEQIRRVLERHRDHVAGYNAEQLLEVDREFHMSILAATGNLQFQKVVIPVWSVVERAMFKMLKMPDVAAIAWDEHEMIAAAIIDGDPDLAESRLRQHLENGAAQLARVISLSD
ncbi:DNA-binding GntR family transcriptional regulator [Arthrobacter sp. SLBN-112]|nr:DNA-binding GntR family transcriptional regulator [Arthrobacter sp. SLBN-112]